MGSVLDLVDEFYTEIAQRLKHVEAPKVKQPEAAEESLGSVNELGQPVEIPTQQSNCSDNGAVPSEPAPGASVCEVVSR